MKSIRRNRVALAVLAALLLALSGTAAVAYANGECPVVDSAREAATEGHFHLYTKLLALYQGNVYQGLVNDQPACSITGNLMTFTHPGTPNSAAIGDWQHEYRVGRWGREWISGSFSIDVGWPGFPPGFIYGPVYGKIYISFNAASTFVPKIDENCEPDHYNFQGTFRITGGDGFYEGIRGSGTIGGTFHDHSWSGDQFGHSEEDEQWFDFVMIGTARFR